MSQISSIKNSSGFTLIEVMVSIVIMMIGMLGLLETLSVSMQHNLKNRLRDEGIRIGERYMTELKATPFDDIMANYSTARPQSKLRGISKEYVVERSSLVLGTDDTGNTSKQVTVVVKWAFRNQTTLNRVVSVVAK